MQALLHHEIRLKWKADAATLSGNLTNDHSAGETGRCT